MHSHSLSVLSLCPNLRSKSIRTFSVKLAIAITLDFSEIVTATDLNYLY
jgi:hypothetical protein